MSKSTPGARHGYSLLASPGLSWRLLACPGVSRRVLASPGMSWRLLACLGVSGYVPRLLFWMGPVTMYRLGRMRRVTL